MSGLIKGSAVALTSNPVLAFGLSPQPLLPEKPERDTLLEDRILELEQAIAAAEKRHLVELDAAREEAGHLALEQRSDAEERVLAVLSDAAAKATQAWNARLDTWEAASIAIARTVLEKVFVDATERYPMVESCIRRRLQLLDTNSVVRVRVSGQDFDEGALTAASATLEERIEIVRDPTLGSGECVFDLNLGQIDAGPGSQWRRIVELLETLESESLEC